MSKKTNIFYSALLLTGVNLLLRLVSTSFQVYISGRIGASGVGLLQLILSVGGMAMTAAMAGIRTATMYLTAGELGKKRPENIYHVLSICVVYSVISSVFVSILLYCLAPTIAVRWIGNEQTIDAIRLFSCVIPVCCLCGVMSGYFTAAGRIRTLAAVEVAEQLCTMAATLTALSVWAKEDPTKACQAVIGGSGIGSCIALSVLTLLRIMEHAPKGTSIPLRKKLLDIAVPLALADDLKTGINTTENLMVPKRLSLFSGATDPLALFGTVCGMVFPVLMFPAAIVFSLAELLIPEMAHCSAAGSFVRIRYLARQSLRIVLLYACTASGILFLLAHPICIWLYDNTDAGNYLSLYAFLAPMLYCDAIVDAMNKGLGQQKRCVRYNILTAALDVLFLYLLLPRYGMIGYFISFLITHLLNFVLSLRLLIKTAGLRIKVWIPLRITFSVAVSILLCCSIASSSLRIVAFILVFPSLLTLQGVLSRKDVLWMKGLIMKSNV